MRISVKAEVKEVQKSLKNLKDKDLPFAISKGINDTLFMVKKKINKDMDALFRGGAVPFTKQGLKYEKSDKKNLEGILYIEAKQYKYLKYQIDGGTRPATGKSIPIPFRNRVSLNKYGNMTKTKIAQLLSSKQNKLLTINGVRGIYKVFKDKARPPQLLVAMKDKSVTYKKTPFKYFNLVDRAAKQYFKKAMEKAAAYAIRTSK